MVSTVELGFFINFNFLPCFDSRDAEFVRPPFNCRRFLDAIALGEQPPNLCWIRGIVDDESIFRRSDGTVFLIRRTDSATEAVEVSISELFQRHPVPLHLAT